MNVRHVGSILYIASAQGLSVRARGLSLPHPTTPPPNQLSLVQLEESQEPSIAVLQPELIVQIAIFFVQLTPSGGGSSMPCVVV